MNLSPYEKHLADGMLQWMDEHGRDLQDALDELKIARELYEMADPAFEKAAYERVKAAESRRDAILATARVEYRGMTA